MMPLNEGRIDIEAEILATILDNPAECLPQALDALSPDAFSRENQTVWRALCELHREKRPVDIVTVYEKVKDQGIPAVYLSGLVGGYFISSARLPLLIELLQSKNLKRRLCHLLNKAADDIAQTDDPVSLVSNLTLELIRATEKAARREQTNPADLVSLVETHIGRAEGLKPIGWPTGIPALDAATQGLIPSFLWILGGRESSGKSTLAAGIEAHLLRQGAKVLHFSLEDATHFVVMRILAVITGIPVMNMLQGNLTPQQRRALDDAMDLVSKATFRVYDSLYDLSHMRLKAMRMQMEEGLDVIVVDYVQNVKAPGNIYERMSEAAVFFQDLAKELNCVLLVLSQMSQESQRNSEGVMGFKGAGELAAACHVGLRILPVKDKEGYVTLDIRKNKYGPVRAIPARFTNNYTRVEQVEAAPAFR